MMKKLQKRALAVAMAFCLVLVMAFSTSFAATDALVVSKTQVSTGDTFTVTFTQPTDVMLSTMGFSLKFDKETFEITSIDQIPYADSKPTPTGSNASGKITISYNDPEYDANTSISTNTVLLSATFKVKDSASAGAKNFVIDGYNVYGAVPEGGYMPEDITPGTDVTGSLTKIVNVVVKISGATAVDITAPVKGATPQATIAEGTGYTGTITWDGNPATFLADTAYTANVTLTAKSGYVFTGGATATVSGATVSNATVAKDGSTMSFKAKFPATAGADALGGTVTISNTNPVIGDTLTADTTALNYGAETAGTLSYQWQAGGENVGTNAASYIVATADYNKTITVTVSNPNNSGSVTSAATAVVEKKAAPAAPTGYAVTGKTDTTITVTANAAWQYSINGGTSWQDSNVLTGLTPNTAYNIVVRVKETDDTQASAAGTAVSATTDLAVQTITGPASVSVVVGGTKDLNTVYSSNANQTLTYTYTGTVPVGTTFANGVITAGTTEGSFTVKINAAATGIYAAAAEKTVTVNITAKATAALVGGVTQTGCTYGETLSDPKFTAPAGATTTVTYAGTLSKDGSAYNSSTKPTEAGTYTVTVACETADTIYSATSAAFTIAQKSVNGMTVTLNKTTTEYSGSAQTVTVTAVGSLTAADYTVSGDTSATAVGEYTVTVTGKGNYKGTATAKWNITAKVLTIANATATNRDYAADNTAVVINGVSFNEAALTLGTDFTVTGVMADANAGNGKTVTVTVTLKNSNYTLAANTTTTTVDIAQIAFGGNIALTKNYRTNSEHSAEVDLTANLNGIAGAAVKAATEGADTDNIISNVTTDSNKVKFDVANVADAGKTATISVTVASTNYTDFTAVITVATIDKNDVADNITFADGELIYTGTALTYEGASVSGISGGTWVYTYAAVTGTLGSDNKPLTAGTYTVTATYEDDDNLGSKAVTLTVKKAVPTGAPKYTAISAAEKTLTDAALTLSDSTITVPGTVKWVDADGAELPNTTVVTANTYYKWLFVPTDTANYENLSGTIKLWSKSSGGGGGGGGGVPSYGITSGKTTNGSLSVSDKNANSGDVVNIIVTPDKGYKVDTVTVTDKNGKVVDVKKNGDGSYSFTQPAGKVTVNATFVKDNAQDMAAEQVFADVADNAYYADAVKWAVEKGITTGATATEFAPDNACTRAQIVTFLYRAAGEPAVSGTANFADVLANDYFAKAVAWAVEKGITTGINDQTFAPNQICTRAEAVTFLWRAAGKPEVEGSAVFADVPADAYFAAAVNWAEVNGITGGIGGNLFGATNECTRAQIVAFLFRAAK